MADPEPHKRIRAKEQPGGKTTQFPSIKEDHDILVAIDKGFEPLHSHLVEAIQGIGKD